VMGITFALYKEQEGGAALWVETQNVALEDSGHYSVLLGANSSEGLPMGLFTTGGARWLGVQPEGQTEQPRVLNAVVGVWCGQNRAKRGVGLEVRNLKGLGSNEVMR
jgi:hypothetical protein